MARSGKNKELSTPKNGEPLAEPTTNDEIDDQTSDDTQAVDAEKANAAATEAQENFADDQPLITKNTARPGAIGIGGVVVGGFFAAAIGFLAAQYSGNDGWPFPADNSFTDELAQKITGLESTIKKQQAELGKLTQELALKANSNELDRLNERLQDSSVISESNATDFAVLASRLTDIENRPVPDPGADQDAVDFYVQELATMRAMLDDELAKIEARQETIASDSADVAELAKSNTIRQAMSRIQWAAENGQPFGDALDEIRSAGLEIKPRLAELAKMGIPTLAALSDEFPVAARGALAASVNDPLPNTDNGNGFVAFLRNQLGMRSLEPMDGESVDAILSRAEAAVISNDISAALAELETLPKDAADEMRMWIERARQRRDGLKLISALATPVSE